MNQSWFGKQVGHEMSLHCTCSLYSANIRVVKFVLSDFMSVVNFKFWSREFQAFGNVTLGNLDSESLHFGARQKLIFSFLGNPQLFPFYLLRAKAETCLQRI